MTKILSKKHRRSVPLWWWVGLRMSALAVGVALTIAFGMWLYLYIEDVSTLSQVPTKARQEIEQLRKKPERNEARLRQLYASYYEIKQFMPGLSNPDWMTFAVMVVVAVPTIIVLGLWVSRPLSRQFTLIAGAAQRVSEGDFETQVKVISVGPDELIGLVYNFNDMTTRLQQYERELRESSAMLAHELRTPLHAAMGRIQGMMDEIFPLEMDQLQSVHRQLEQINRLVGDLHLVSLARAGQLLLERDDFSLRDLIAERLEWAAPRLQAVGIAPTWPSTTPIRLYADRDRIGQVLSILIDNVLRYAAQGKVLEIGVQQTSDAVTITIGDRGTGVADEQIASMVDRFWRAENSRARHSGGSGLGLAIAAAICQAHTGKLECRKRDGGGLLVVAQLPIQIFELDMRS